MSDGKAKDLEARLLALKLEISRKNKMLEPKLSPEEFLLSELHILLSHFSSLPPAAAAAAATNTTPSSTENNTVYPLFLDSIIASSMHLEQQARKVYLAYSTNPDLAKEDRIDLCKSMLAPLEQIVALLLSVHASHDVISLLKLPVVARGKEACSTCIKFISALQIPSEAQTCRSCLGQLEALTEKFRLLPKSNAGAVKRQLLEICRSTIGDCAREFSELAESTTVPTQNDFFGDDEDDDEEEEEEEEGQLISQQDKERLVFAAQTLLALKQYLLGMELPLEGLVTLEQISHCLLRLDKQCTDFGVELYPPHDGASIAVQASGLLKCCEELETLVKTQAVQFESLKLKLSVVVA